ncbi:MAG: L-dopachrome tautomerase-related protein [bacterium]
MQSVIRKKLIYLMIIFLVCFVIAICLFWLKFGGRGKPFPDLSTKPMLPPNALKIVAKLDIPPGNIAVSSKGRIFFNYHPEGNPELKVMEIKNGKPVPYPNLEMQHERKNKPYFDMVFNLRIDSKDRLWTLDTGFHGLRKPRLMAFDLNTDKLVYQYDFPVDIAGEGSYIQDMQIDPQSKHIYIADIGVFSGKPAIISFDTTTRKARRLLERDTSVIAESYEINAKGHKMYPLFGLYWMHPAIDPIGLDKKGEWLYFGPMSGSKLYRIKTAVLNNTDLSSKELSQKVEFYSKKPQCDGISLDKENNIYLTSIEDGAISVITKDKKLKTLVKSPIMRWPDGLSFGKNSELYITDSDIPDVIMQPATHIMKSKPFYIFKVNALAYGVAGQ